HFGDRLYVELQRHNTPDEVAAEGGLIDLAYELEIPLVASNEPFFAEAGDYAAHDALLCISQGAVVIEEDRRRLTPEHYFKSPREMAALFADIPEAIENTIEIARRCSHRPVRIDPILPKFATQGGQTEADLLREKAEAGLKDRLAKHGVHPGFEEKDYWDRLAYELKILIDMDFPGYFLIVADFIQWSKSQDIPVGPGRGSGAGSVTAWALTITDLDPLRFGLIFERFLNPERIEMPDFDIDFCQDRREEVIRYVQDKYGHDQVAQIITFGKLQARAVVRDVGRVLQMPYGQVDRLSKLIPNNPANPMTLGEAIEAEPRLAEERDREEAVATLLEYGLKLEGLYRHASTHAAGVVIGDRPLDELVPLYRDPRSDMPVTQFNMKWVDKAGLVKFDFLGLKTLTTIQKACLHLKARNIEIDPVAIPLDDGPTFDMLKKRETIGVFQYESSGMQDLMRKAQPENIEDLIAIVALFRPGPMENIPKYVACKHGEEEPEFLHKTITPVLEDTYGVIIYQEQVLKIAQVLAGYSLGEADILRKAMGKKIKEEMDRQRVRFVKGALAGNDDLDEAHANFIFDLVAKFAGYGFNKAHSACYAFVAYQTAYLKANYPVEFLAASMTLDMGNTDKLAVFAAESKRLGIDVLPPDINNTEIEFAVKDGAVVYTLSALKNVGQAAVDHLCKVRGEGGPFKSFGDFANRVDGRTINKRALESMAKAGAFDSLNPNRAQVLAGTGAILGMASRTSADAELGQNDMFGGGDLIEDVVLPVTEPWLPLEKLNAEFEAIGFYLSGHPLDDYLSSFGALNVDTYTGFVEKALKKGARAGKLAGTVVARQERTSKSGNKFAFVSFSDPTGQYETVCFGDLLGNVREMLEPGTGVILRVEADVEDEEVKLRLQGVELLDKAVNNVAQGLTIFVRDETPLDSIAKRLTNGGKSPVKLVVQVENAQEISV
ncbi:MAG TPA: DNA polymerase III subunit alpha, partial [Rhizobiales bacterium]|nr:DNA polymerase III subunit alpha [Hyphomicrobiales bacterium]